MIFWRIFDNQLYTVGQVNQLGFEESEGVRIPDEYLEQKVFTVFRTAHGIGDWGIISAMPRLLKQKYPDCKVYVPSPKMLRRLFGQMEQNWSSWNDPFVNVEHVFKNNPYVDAFKDHILGEVFHDHYRVYDNDNLNVPLVEQMLKFWQFEESEYEDSQPEVYFSDEEKELGDKIINEHCNGEFGTLLISDRFKEGSDAPPIVEKLEENPLPYFYWSPKPLNRTPFDFIDKALDLRHVHPRIQLYIKSKAKLNIGNQCGTNHLAVRYSDDFEVQRQYPLKHNFVKGVEYLHQKKIILIGNAKGDISIKVGEKIDSFDEVIRFNRFTTENFEDAIGSRCTGWIINRSLLNDYRKYYDKTYEHNFENYDLKFCKMMVHMYPNGANLNDLNIEKPNLEPYDTRQETAFFYKHIPDYEKETGVKFVVEKEDKHGNPISNPARASTGIIAIIHFMEKYSKIFLSNFDHGRSHHYFGNDKKHDFPNIRGAHDWNYEAWLVDKFRKKGKIKVLGEDE